MAFFPNADALTHTQDAFAAIAAGPGAEDLAGAPVLDEWMVCPHAAPSSPRWPNRPTVPGYPPPGGYPTPCTLYRQSRQPAHEGRAGGTPLRPTPFLRRPR